MTRAAHAGIASAKVLCCSAMIQPFLISVHLPCEFCKGTGRMQSLGVGADPAGYPCATCNQTGFNRAAKPISIDKFKEALGLK